jgi:hypothetical protein
MLATKIRSKMIHKPSSPHHLTLWSTRSGKTSKKKNFKAQQYIPIQNPFLERIASWVPMASDL